MKITSFSVAALSLFGLTSAQPHGRRKLHHHPHKSVAGGSGITYTPYNPDNSCKSKEQVANDIAGLASYSRVRIYGTDCNQVENVVAAAKAHNIQLMLGIWDVRNVQNEADIIIKTCKGSWDMIETVSVGNEIINGGRGSVDEVTGAIGQARGILRAAGYSGPVVTTDTFIAIIANPALCQASDFAAANCHAFYDQNVAAADAGAFVAAQAARVKAACGGKRTVITESGWPSAGINHDKAVASPEAQAAAVSSIRSHMGGDVFLFTAYNDLWKQPGQYSAEQSYGILN